MKRALTIAMLLLTIAGSAAAQTEGRVSVGGIVTFVQPTDSEVESLVGIGPLVRLNPKERMGPGRRTQLVPCGHRQSEWCGGDFAQTARAAADGWHRLHHRRTARAHQLLLRCRTVVQRSRFRGRFPRLAAPGSKTELDAKNSFAMRPGVGLTWTVAPRVAIVGFGGYMINRPDVVYRDMTGQEYPQPLEGRLRSAQRRRGLLAFLRSNVKALVLARGKGTRMQRAARTRGPTRRSPAWPTPAEGHDPLSTSLPRLRPECARRCRLPSRSASSSAPSTTRSATITSACGRPNASCDLRGPAGRPRHG